MGRDRLFRSFTVFVLLVLLCAGGDAPLPGLSSGDGIPSLGATVWARQETEAQPESEDAPAAVKTPTTASKEAAEQMTQDEAAAAARADTLRRLSHIAWWAAGICGVLATLTIAIMTLAHRHRRRIRSRRRSVYGVDLDARLPAHGRGIRD